MRVVPAAVLAGLLSGTSAAAKAEEPPSPRVAAADSSWVEADGRVRLLYRPRFVAAPDLLAGAKSLNLGPVDLAFDGLRSRLLLTGARVRLEDALEALEFLDVATPEVLVEIAVIETACRRRRETGGHTLFDRGPSGPDTFFRSFRHDFEPESWLRSQLVGGRPFEGASVVFGETSSSGAFAGTLEAVLRGLAHEGESDVVARPTLLCTEGVPARVESTLLLPATLFGRVGDVVTTTLANEKAGVVLEVTAEFVGSDGVRLKIHPWIRRVEEDQSEDGPLSYPVLGVRELSTTIRVADGESVVVGGLEGLRRVRNRNGLPVLDRLPALDGALSSRLSEEETTDIQVLVRARIVTPGRAPPRYVPPGEPERLARRGAGAAPAAAAAAR